MSEALRAKSEPEDLAQEIVIAAFRDFSQFHGASVPEFGAWYWMIAANRLRDLVDYHGAKKRQPAEIPALTQTSPSQAAVTSDLAARVRRAIETLGEEQRMAVCLVFLEERSPEEAARILDKTVNAVRILYFRAMRELRARLGQTG
jgi:RNA polymerase sigma-70 factor (ECF subfamily)